MACPAGKMENLLIIYLVGGNMVKLLVLATKNLSTWPKKALNESIALIVFVTWSVDAG